jgi:hypothetical protein
MGQPARPAPASTDQAKTKMRLGHLFGRADPPSREDSGMDTDPRTSEQTGSDDVDGRAELRAFFYTLLMVLFIGLLALSAYEIALWVDARNG